MQVFLRKDFPKIDGLIPNSGWQTVFLHEIPAARAATWISPRLHIMLSLHRTSRLKLVPDHPPAGGPVPQNHRRNFGPEKTGKFDFFHRTLTPTKFGKDIQQLPAVAAHHGLHLAMKAAVRPTRNFRAVMTIGTFKVIGPAHDFFKCQPAPAAGNQQIFPPTRPPMPAARWPPPVSGVRQAARAAVSNAAPPCTPGNLAPAPPPGRIPRRR